MYSSNKPRDLARLRFDGIELLRPRSIGRRVIDVAGRVRECATATDGQFTGAGISPRVPGI